MLKQAELPKREKNNMSIFSGVLKDVVKGAEWLKSEVVKAAEAAPGAIAKVEADAPEVEALANVIFPGSSAFVSAGLSVLEEVAGAIESAGSAAEANLLSAGLDQAVINNVKALIPAIKGLTKA